MHTIREEMVDAPACGGYRIGIKPTGNWLVGTRTSGFGGTVWRTAVVCKTQEEAIEVCRKLNGGPS